MVPMKIFPGVHYSMGGLWTQYTAKDDLRGMAMGSANSMMTNIPGLYAFGEVNYQYHGANRLGANALLSCIFDGLFCGAGVANYVLEVVTTTSARLDQSTYEAAVRQQQEIVDRLINARGMESPYQIGRHLLAVMELHALAEFELERQIVESLPFRGQTGHQPEPPLEVD